MIKDIKTKYPEFYQKIMDNLSEKFAEEDLIVLEDNIVGADNGKLKKLFGCPFCYLEPVRFNENGLPSIHNIPLETPESNEFSDKLPVEIIANLLHCPKCKILINILPKYNTYLGAQ